MSIGQSFILFEKVKSIVTDAHRAVVRNVNAVMVYPYFQIGRMIVEDEQKGSERAGYAKEIISRLSLSLNQEFGKGYSVSNLEYMRNFYLAYQDRISQSVTGISQSPFSLSWTHYVQLLKIKDINERNFYEIESVNNSWSVRELQRQFNSAFYERIALSKEKNEIRQLSQSGQQIEKPTDLLKSHYVLEFLGLEEKSKYSETDLEADIINKLENFMLELGKGFLFEGRQRRFTFEGDSFFVDLVFYNRLLRCFVLLDLKIGKLTHQDIGQMQMYVNYYDRKIKLPEEKPTIGIILCKEENRTVIEFTLPEKNEQIFAKEYKAVLPSKDALRKQLE